MKNKVKTKLKKLALPPSRKYFLYVFYFILGFVTSVNEYSVMMRVRDYGLSMAEISYLRVFPAIPWFIKFLFGGVSDNIPICGYNRKPYVLVANLIAAITCWLLMLPNLKLSEYIGLLTLLSTFCAWSDVIYDALMVEDGRSEPVAKSGRLQVGCKYSRSFGRILATMGPYLWHVVDDDGIYAIMSAFYLFASFLSLVMYDFKRSSVAVAQGIDVKSIELDGEGNNLHVIPDDFMDDYTASKNCCFQMGLVRESFKHKILRTLLGFSIFIGLSPSSGLPTFYFINDVLRFSSLQMSLLSFAGEIGQLLGLTIYYRWLMQWRLRTTYIVVSFFAIFITLVPLVLVTRVDLEPGESCKTSYNNETTNMCYLFEQENLEPVAFALSDDVFGAVLDELRSIPLERVTAVICITAVEATVFSTMLSIRNLTWVVRSWIDAAFLRVFEIDHGKFGTLPAYIKFCAFFEFLAFLFAFVLPKTTIAEIADSVKKQKIPVEQIRFKTVPVTSANATLEEHEYVSFYIKEEGGIVNKVVDEMVEGEGRLNQLGAQ